MSRPSRATKSAVVARLATAPPSQSGESAQATPLLGERLHGQAPALQILGRVELVGAGLGPPAGCAVGARGEQAADLALPAVDVVTVDEHSRAGERLLKPFGGVRDHGDAGHHRLHADTPP